MTQDDRRIASGRDFKAAVFPSRSRERDRVARDHAKSRARELGESLAHEHLQGLRLTRARRVRNQGGRAELS